MFQNLVIIVNYNMFIAQLWSPEMYAGHDGKELEEGDEACVLMRIYLVLGQLQFPN